VIHRDETDLVGTGWHHHRHLHPGRARHHRRTGLAVDLHADLRGAATALVGELDRQSNDCVVGRCLSPHHPRRPGQLQHRRTVVRQRRPPRL
jgi:hypothetical protein